MKYWLQYHNYDNLAYLPGRYESAIEEILSLDTSDFTNSSITTSKSAVLNAIGDVVFLVVGYGGKLKKYALWSWMFIDEIEEADDGRFDAFGDGVVLNPPQPLFGPDFDQFKKSMANFSLGFRDVSQLPFVNRLIQLANQFAKFERTSSYTAALRSDPDEVQQPEKFFEGALRVVCVNAYERNPKARRQCLEYYGTRCVICGLDFAERYGELAKGIIHVHHLRPLAEIGEEYQVDPINDLRPVCPNCHAVIHWTDPSMTIEQVKGLLSH